jgi:hypothetical protein
MNPDQLEACMANLLPDDAREFERLQREASERLAQGWELRKLAWELYQERRIYRSGARR